MQTFWSELGFWWKRRVRAWNLVMGVPLCVYLTYLLVDSVRNSPIGIRLSHLLHESPEDFFITTGFVFSMWMVCLLLTICKALSLLWPEPEPPLLQPRAKGVSDETVWPPPPKPGSKH